MALDRTWYNALVDDDGSGLTGSVWDKADIKNLLDTIDAELLRIDTGIAGPITPFLQSYGGGTPVYAQQLGQYVKIGKLLFVGGRVTLSSKGSLAAGQLVLAGFPFAASASIYQAGLNVGYFTGLITSASMVTSNLNPSLGSANLFYIPGAGGSGIAPLNVADVNATFDLMFGGVYKTDT